MNGTSSRPVPPATARFLIFVLTGMLAGGVTSADDWGHWRGSNRDGKSREPSGWDGSRWPLREIWRAEVGRGANSPVIHQQRLYVAGWRDNKDSLYCLDAASGKKLWVQSYKGLLYGRHSTGDKSLYAGSCSTPELDSATGLLYTLGIDGQLRCWNVRQQGREVWSLNLYDRFSAPRRPKVGRSGLRDYGYTSSPLVTEKAVVVEVGSTEQGCLMGFGKASGKLLWQSENKQQAGHTNGPAPMTVEGVPCAAVHNFEGLLVVRLDAGHEGQTVATRPWRTDFANNIAAVAVEGDSVLITSGYNHHQISRLRITLNGATEVWSVGEASKVCTPVIHQGHVYWAWRQLMCLDWDTGKLAWKGGRFGDAGSCIVTADDRLIVWGGRGDLALVESAKRSLNAYQELALMRRLGGSDAWPHVALAEGRVFCKDREGRLVALEISGRQ